MREDACLLSLIQRSIVEKQVAETCSHRGWVLHAVNCRSNHVHIVVAAANTHPRKIQADLKAWCARRLSEQSDATRSNWWAERGSQRYINDEDGLERAIAYTLDAQDQKHRDRPEAEARAPRRLSE